MTPITSIAAAIALITTMIAIGYSLHVRRHIRGIRKQTQAAEELFTDLAKAATDWIWESDSSLHLTSISEGFGRCTGYDQGIFIGEVLNECASIGMDEELRRSIAIAVASQRSFREVNCRFDGPEGETHYFKISGRPFFDADGRIKGYRGGGVDISDLVAAKDRVRFLDRHDPLTGLPNRMALREELDRVLKHAHVTKTEPVLIAIDIARFGTINDAFGAAAGDHVLRQFAERLHVCLLPDDMLFRQGNDEFLVLRPTPSKFEMLEELLEKIASTLGEAFEVEDQRVRIGSHVGVYVVDPDEREVEICIRRAQIALRHGKSVGERTTVYSEGMDVEAEISRRLEEDLRISIRSDGLVLNYQPQLSLKEGRIVGAEALVRWHHRDHGFVSPARFIPLAERTGLITDLSRWALRQACHDALQWNGLHVAVNLSPIDVRHDDFIDWIGETVGQSGMPPARIELEITESVLIEDTETGLDKLRALKAMGFRIALDDFGTGYAGMGYLQMFPFDKLKIDQSFIKRMTRSKHAMAIVRSVIKLGHELDLVVCAEGVEHEEQLQALLVGGADVIQGYYTGLPMAASRVRALAEKHNREVVEPKKRSIMKPSAKRTVPIP
ncbi:MAG: EAL domain-containing protein [Geminicoccaceae bacterium]|nr:EAL domain-containing protein [Geminicoccaceae bacterium]